MSARRRALGEPRADPRRANLEPSRRPPAPQADDPAGRPAAVSARRSFRCENACGEEEHGFGSVLISGSILVERCFGEVPGKVICI